MPAEQSYNAFRCLSGENDVLYRGVVGDRLGGKAITGVEEPSGICKIIVSNRFNKNDHIRTLHLHEQAFVDIALRECITYPRC